MRELHVVIGRGMVGTRLARMLAEGGREVRWVSRRPKEVAAAGVQQVAADAASLESLLAVAPTAKIVYNCVNPPNYHRWEHEWPPLARTISAYAMRAGADLVTASNLYGYGPHDGVLTEALPLRAQWRNGRVRAAMWHEALALHDAGKLRVTEVRGSDYLCASDQSRMGDRVVPNLLRGKPVQLLGALDQPHTWTDPDDVARLMMTLAEDERSWGKPWHVPSPEPRTQRQVVADIAAAAGVNAYRLSALGPVMEAIIGLFNPVVRELNRGGYQFTRPFIMSSHAAQATFGVTPKPWRQVIDDLVQPYVAQAQRKGERP
jgi:nucleoside-diphosphate-sugar epimerase